MSRPVAVITGGARGIGLEAARQLGSSHRVALLDLDGDGAHRAAAGLGGDAIAVQCDITDEASVAAAVEQVVAEAGGIDVCISNAGIATAGALRMLDPEVVAAQLNVNLVGNWRFVHACLPHVIARRGYVLGVASAAALAPTGGLGAYCASKAGLEMLLNCLRIEVAHLGVDVGVAYFAFIDTEMVRGTDLHHPGFNRMREDAPGPFGKTIPVSRAGGSSRAGSGSAHASSSPPASSGRCGACGACSRRASSARACAWRPRSTRSPPRWSRSAARSAAACAPVTRAPRRPRAP